MTSVLKDVSSKHELNFALLLHFRSGSCVLAFTSNDTCAAYTFSFSFCFCFVGQEGIKAKKNLATDKTADELNAVFEPGQDFAFDATLDLEEDLGDAEAKPEAETSESEVVSA